MSQRPPTPSSARDQLKNNTPDAVVALIDKQLERAAEAARRIESEGLVVRDMKGSVIAHPAISIEASASKLACDLIGKWKKG